MIRTESKADYIAVYDLNVLAFSNRNDESELIERIRKSDDFIPELSIVAEENGAVIGHILISKAMIVSADRDYEVLVLAPVAVHPERQKEGIGGKLILEGLKRSKDMGYSLVLLIGHPSYYPKFGFKPARQFGLELKQYEVPDEVFMVYELQEGELGQVKGELIYPDTFFDNKSM